MKEICLAKSDLKALVDDEDYDKISKFRWSVQKKNGHVKGYVGKQVWQNLSRFILNIKDPKVQVDHIDHNKLNNQKYNLRPCTNAQNSRNRRKTEKSFTSLYKGVSWEKRVNKWRCTLTFNYKQLYIGRFLNEKEAALAYNEKAKEFFGEFAYLNEVN